MSAVPQPKRHKWHGVGIAALGLLVMVLGAIVGTGSSLQFYPDFHEDCALPASTTILQTIEFPKNKPDSSIRNTVTVTLPSSNPFARMLAGQASSRKDRLRALQCLFGTVPTTPTDITQKDQTTSIKISADYIAYGFIGEPRVVADGLRFDAPITSTVNSFGGPKKVHATLQIKAPGRQVMYSEPPSQRDPGMLTWKWTLTSTDSLVSNPKSLRVTVPLGPGEHLSALVQYSGNLHYFGRVNSFDFNLNIYLPSLLLGWLGPVAATLSLLVMLQWYRRRVNIRERRLAIALLLPVLPVLVAVYVFWSGWALPVTIGLPLICILVSEIFFLDALNQPPLCEHQPALTGRSAGVAAWLPLASVTLVALVLPAFVPWHPAEPPGSRSSDVAALAPLVAIVNIIAVLVLAWVVSALVLIFTRSSLRALSVWTTPTESLADTGGIGTAVVRWYHLAAGVITVVSAYAVGYELANSLGKALNAYRIGAVSAASATGQLVTDIANIGVFPVVFLLLPVAATFVAAIVNSTLSSSAITVGVVATATLAWATTSRALDLNLAGTSLPVGAWILTALVALSLRKPLDDSANGQTKPWLPERESPQFDSSSRATLRVRLGRWLAQVQPEDPKEPPLPGTMVQRGPFRDARARANLALAWGTLLSVVPVAYLIWGTLTALPKNGSDPTNTSYVLSQIVTEIVRWTLTGWLYGLLLPLLPGRVGPVKALWLSGTWFVASAPVAIVDIWTGAGQGRVWLFPGLQLLLFLTALAVLMDLSTVHAWAAREQSRAEKEGREQSHTEKAGKGQSWTENWSMLLAVYNFEGARKVALYAVPAVAAVIAIGQQVVSGTGLDFVNSLLSGAQSLFSGR